MLSKWQIVMVVTKTMAAVAKLWEHWYYFVYIILSKI